MSEHNDDIDFDFFSKPEPEPQKRRMGRRPGGQPPGGPPPPTRTGGHPPAPTPLARLVLMAVFAIVVIVILIFAVQSCSGSSKSGAYRSYFEKVQVIAAGSQSTGESLSNLLARPGLTEVSLESTLHGLIDSSQQSIDRALALKPPSTLRGAQSHIIESLQFRRNGLTWILNEFKRSANKKAKAEPVVSLKLAAGMYKLVASDVVWSDLFVGPARKAMREDGVAGLTPPSSVFVIDPNLAARDQMGRVWQSIHGFSTSGTNAGGLHGTDISWVRVYPGGHQLIQGQQAHVAIGGFPSFVVAVTNGGDFLERNITVTLEINDTPKIKQTRTIKQILNGETQKVTFGGPSFSISSAALKHPVEVKVDVSAVVGEKYLDNNHRVYDVQFSYQ